MKGKIIIIISSLLVSTFLVSSGYGLWHEKLTIKGRIEVIEPELQTETSIPMISNDVSPGSGGSSSGDNGGEAIDTAVSESNNNSPSETEGSPDSSSSANDSGSSSDGNESSAE